MLSIRIFSSLEKTGLQKIDWRASLATDEQRELFDKLKEFRAKFSKEKHLVGAYMVCKDEHLASIVQNPDITLEEIKSLPHLNSIMLKDFAEELFSEYQKTVQNFSRNVNKNLQIIHDRMIASPPVVPVNKSGQKKCFFLISFFKSVQILSYFFRFVFRSGHFLLYEFWCFK